MSLLNVTPRRNRGGGRPRAAALAHEGASLTSQQLASWRPWSGSPDADLLTELPMLVSRSRDLSRNNGIASGAVQTHTDNVVGTGLRLQATPDWAALGRDSEWANAWARKTEGLWRSYSRSTTCDAARRHNFAGLTTLAYKSALLNGDLLALPIWQPEPMDRFATRIALMESDRLSNPNNAMDSQYRRGGMDIDQYGRALKYWIRKTHPGDCFAGVGMAGEWEGIPATTDWGRMRVIYAGDVDRAGATRAKPIFSAVMQQFKQLDRYASAELDAAVTNAMIAAFVESPMEFSDLLEMLGGDAATAKAYMDTRAMPQNRAKLKSGAIVPLYPGEKLSAFNPARPATGFAAFMEATHRHLATGLNLPYELLLKDFSKTNYSSARAALLEAWRYFRSKRAWVSDYWAQPIYELWLEEAVSLGLVEAPDFYENRAAYCSARWIGAGRGWVDPVKEAQAAAMRIDGGFSTLEAECAEQGLDWEEVLHQQARENELRRRLGLLLPAKVVPAPADDGEEEGEDDNPAPPEDGPENEGDDPA